MNRRGFITYASLLGSSIVLQGNHSFMTSEKRSGKKYKNSRTSEMQADVIIMEEASEGAQRHSPAAVTD